MHIHLDAVGGVAGDMFVAALLDAWPELETGLGRTLTPVLPEGVHARRVPHKDHALTGSRFEVESRVAPHHHTAFRHIRENLAASELPGPVRDRAIAIFTLLAEVEGRVHGVAPEDVTFHEVGAWDSIADIVAAAILIEATGATSWSVSSLPLGRGRVKTAHGPLPVPAPATALLLEGFAVHDDGLDGERVTPTGAALLRHLNPAPRAPSDSTRLARTGHGFGTRTLPGTSNVLRALALEPLETATTRERVAVLQFEVDDQSPEDLAVGLDRLRATEGVLDVVQIPAYGKKGRLGVQVQVLSQAAAVDTTLAACFRETTTLGVRYTHAERAVLERSTRTWIAPEGSVQVKSARRPGGEQTAKAEIDDVADAPGGHAERERRRRAAVDAAAAPRDDVPDA